MKQLKVALYARVSTNNKGQDPLNQLRQLREFAGKQGWAITEEYTDHASGKNGDRIHFRRMMTDAGRHKFDLLLFWSLDRLTREGQLKTLFYLCQLTDSGVKWKSYTEQYLDTMGIFGPVVAGILATLAQQQRLRISEQTKAGLARVKAQGQRLGRPRGGRDINVTRARKLKADGLSYTDIARKMKLSRSMVWTRLNQA